MPKLPPIPELPNLPEIDKNPIKTAGGFIKEAASGIQQTAREIDRAAREIDSGLRSPAMETKTPIEEVASATACLQCSRDHYSTVSGALSEALRFARSDGIASKDAQGRIGIALDELNIMERIDLAPQALAQLKSEEKKLAEWSLKNSRQLRHTIGEISTIDDMEKAAAEAARLREDFMSRYGELKRSFATECRECEALEDLRTYLDRRKEAKKG